MKKLIKILDSTREKDNKIVLIWMWTISGKIDKKEFLKLINHI
jgi:hypothetical protein